MRELTHSLLFFFIIHSFFFLFIYRFIFIFILLFNHLLFNVYY